MKVIFRCDAGGEFGLGRLARSWALADEFSRSGVEAVFAMHGGEHAFLENAGYEVIDLESSHGADHDRRIAQLAGDAEFVVADSRELGTLDILRLRSMIHPARLALIDDLADRYVSCAAVINPNPSAYLCRYDLPVDCRPILGPTYALIRPDVARLAREPCEPSEIPRVVVCMGAFDKGGLTAAVLEILDGFKEEFSITALMMPSAPTLSDVRRCVEKMSHPVTFEVGHKNVSAVFHGASMAVCAGGTTALELACLGVPAGYLADPGKDEEIAEALAHNGAGVFLGHASELDLDFFVRGVHALLGQRQARASISRTASQLIDGKGAERVVAKLTKYGIITLD